MPRGIFALVARNRGGKDTVCGLIRERVAPESVQVIHFSDAINECLDILGLPQGRPNQQTFSTVNREAFGQDLLADVVLARIRRSSADWVVVNGVRRPPDVTMLRTLGGVAFVHVDASLKLRYERMIQANEREGDGTKTWEEFLAEEEQECERLIDEVALQCSFYIDNSSSPEDLRRRIYRLVDLVAQQ